MTSDNSTDDSEPEFIRCGKWISLRDADDCISSAARITLEARLAAVAYYLPLAGLRSKEAIEHVHQLRVSTRRVLAALELYRDCLPGKRVRRMKRRMKRIRDVAGVVRDLDVLAQRYRDSGSKKHKRLLRRLGQLRRKGRRKLIDLDRELNRSSCLDMQVQKLLLSIEDTSALPLDEFARSQLTDHARCYFESAKSDFATIEDLHGFRIQAKALRYTIELLGDALDERVRSDIYPIVCKTQDLLGELNDYSVAHSRLKRLAKAERRKRHAKRFKELARAEKQKVVKTKQRFLDWWTPKYVSEFESEFYRLLNESTVAEKSPTAK